MKQGQGELAHPYRHTNEDPFPPQSQSRCPRASARNSEGVPGRGENEPKIWPTRWAPVPPGRNDCACLFNLRMFRKIRLWTSNFSHSKLTTNWKKREEKKTWVIFLKSYSSGSRTLKTATKFAIWSWIWSEGKVCSDNDVKMKGASQRAAPNLSEKPWMQKYNSASSWMQAAKGPTSDIIPEEKSIYVLWLVKVKITRSIISCNLCDRKASMCGWNRLISPLTFLTRRAFVLSYSSYRFSISCFKVASSAVSGERGV